MFCAACHKGGVNIPCFAVPCFSVVTVALFATFYITIHVAAEQLFNIESLLGCDFGNIYLFVEIIYELIACVLRFGAIRKRNALFKTAIDVTKYAYRTLHLCVKSTPAFFGVIIQ